MRLNYKRTFFNTRKFSNLHNSVIPLIIYNDIESQKFLIFKDNKGKTGIYR